MIADIALDAVKGGFDTNKTGGIEAGRLKRGIGRKSTPDCRRERVWLSTVAGCAVMKLRNVVKTFAQRGRACDEPNPSTRRVHGIDRKRLGKTTKGAFEKGCNRPKNTR